MAFYGSKCSQANKSTCHGQITTDQMPPRFPYCGMVIYFRIQSTLKVQKVSKVRNYVFRVVNSH